MSIQTKDNLKDAAKRWIDLLSEPNCRVPDYQRYIPGALKTGGWTLEDIGSSEEKLAELARLAYKNSAKYELGLLSKLDCKLPNIAISIKDSLKKGGWTLEDIDSSEEKLAELVRLAYKNKHR